MKVSSEGDWQRGDYRSFLSPHFHSPIFAGEAVDPRIVIVPCKIRSQVLQSTFTRHSDLEMPSGQRSRFFRLPPQAGWEDVSDPMSLHVAVG